MANEETRLLLATSPLRFEQVRDLDVLWRESSGSRFGFSLQLDEWKKVGGSTLARESELWQSFERLGDQIGWRRGGHWVCWADVECPPPAPILPAVLDPKDAPHGLLPFHDVMTSAEWKHEFSPRDCWGEAAWNRWAELFRLLTVEPITRT